MTISCIGRDSDLTRCSDLRQLTPPGCHTNWFISPILEINGNLERFHRQQVLWMIQWTRRTGSINHVFVFRLRAKSFITERGLSVDICWLIKYSSATQGCSTILPREYVSTCSEMFCCCDALKYGHKGVFISSGWIKNVNYTPTKHLWRSSHFLFAPSLSQSHTGRTKTCQLSFHHIYMIYQHFYMGAASVHFENKQRKTKLQRLIYPVPSNIWLFGINCVMYV